MIILKKLLEVKGLLLLAMALLTLLNSSASTMAGRNTAFSKVDKLGVDPFLIWKNWGDEYKEDYAYEEGVAITYRVLIIETYSGYGVLCVSAWDSERTLCLSESLRAVRKLPTVRQLVQTSPMQNGHSILSLS